MRLVTANEALTRVVPAVLIAAMRDRLGTGGIAPPRAHHFLDEGGGDTLLLMPAWRDGSLGVKIASVHAGNAAMRLPTVMATYLLMDRHTGALRAVIDGCALTVLRTAAVSAVASDALARPNASRLAMIGTGALAPHLISAHRAVRQITEVRIVGRDLAKARALADSLRCDTAAITALSTVEEAVVDADIVCCATTSRTPLIRAALLAPGVHVDLVGSFRPDTREATADVFKCAQVVTDSPAAPEECGDLLVPIARGLLDRAAVRSLADVLTEPQGRHQSPFKRTVFKSIGTALADLIAAEHILSLIEG